MESPHACKLTISVRIYIYGHQIVYIDRVYGSVKKLYTAFVYEVDFEMIDVTMSELLEILRTGHKIVQKRYVSLATRHRIQLLWRVSKDWKTYKRLLCQVFFIGHPVKHLRVPIGFRQKKSPSRRM